MSAAGDRRLQFGILGGTLTGNRGAEAMVTACAQELRARFPGCGIHVLTYYPGPDRMVSRRGDGIFLHSATPAKVLSWCANAIAGRWRDRPRALALRDGHDFASLVALDAVLDVAGVSFIDGREKFLPYNVLSIWPFLACGVPVFKLSQALGPITSHLNRAAASLILPALQLVVARGSKTRSHLTDFGLSEELIHEAPDVSFLLRHGRVRPYDRRAKRVAIIPSSIVRRARPNYVDEMAALIRELRAEEYEVLILPHAARGEARTGRNNDLLVAREISTALGTHTVPVNDAMINAASLRTLIGGCRLVITSRFHGMIGGIATATPTVTVGWSHKYEEVSAPFGLADATFDAKRCHFGMVREAVWRLLESGSQVSGALTGASESARSRARTQFDIVADHLAG